VILRSRGPDSGPAGSRPAVRWLILPTLLLPALLLLSACTAQTTPDRPAPDEQASPFTDCGALTAAPPSAVPASSTSAGAGLPDVELPCFTGGALLRLADVRGPAVINMWASWCEPCRDELPVMQDLADRAGGRLHVLGVDTGDARDAAASFAAARTVTMPTLYDRDKKVLSALGRATLPVTIFIDSAGRDYVHPVPVDDAFELSRLLREHTGVAVTP
jgi:cytochrome c biogenesis protein CcmG, thiol:disulfide interchange protein DsbE